MIIDAFNEILQKVVKQDAWNRIKYDEGTWNMKGHCRMIGTGDKSIGEIDDDLTDAIASTNEIINIC